VQTTSSPRILIVQPGDLGDLILSTPAISALREAYPNAFIGLLAVSNAAPVIPNNGLVDVVITLDRKIAGSTVAFFKPDNLKRIFSLRQYRFDTVLYFRQFTLKAGTAKFALIALATGAKRQIGLQNGNGWFLTESLPDQGFGAKHQAQYWLDLAGLVGADITPRPAVVAMAESSPLPSQLPAKTPGRPRVVIHAGSGGFSLARRWSPEGFAAVASRLHQTHQVEIILVGGKGDDADTVEQALSPETRIDTVNFSGRTSLAELASVLSSADVFIGADSGVMHLAAAAGAPIAAIFGPSNPDAWGPWTPQGRQIVIRSAPECSPCSYIDHTVGLRDGCPARTCMRMVTPAQVYDAAVKLLNGEDETLRVGTRHAVSGTPIYAWPRLKILDIPVDALTYDQWLDLIAQWVNDKQPNQRPHHVCTVNPEFMVTAQRDVNFRNILRRCDLCIPDGIGLLYAARMLGGSLPQRVTGSDGLPIIAERAAREGWRLYLLGAAEGIAEKTAAILSEQYPGLQIAGVYSGSPAPEEEDAIVERINASQADLLFVAYGAPEQDKWIARNLPRLQVKMAMGVGGAFDFIAGVLPRAPIWLRRAGLEWLYRLYLQPSRIRRQLRLPLFVLLVLRDRLRGKRL
jgi:N-acetylglucosaminyldiphosphoundecaprenol N-acetyl-beta-D-mannosaminyltransferase